MAATYRLNEDLCYWRIQWHAILRRRFLIASRALSAREKEFLYSFNAVLSRRRATEFG
jgi:hypothetical protein